MSIAVCGGSAYDHKTLSAMLRRRLSELCADVPLSFYTDISGLTQALDELKIVFIDADMDDCSGIKLASRMRVIGSSCPIVFFSRSGEHALRCYEAHPVDYLLKPFNYPQICQALDRCKSVISDYLLRLDIVASRIPLSIYLMDIMYIEVQGRTCLIHTVTGSLSTNRPLKEILHCLDRGPFLHCHRSFLVNAAYINKLTRNGLLMADGNTVPVSSERREAARMLIESR